MELYVKMLSGKTTVLNGIESSMTMGELRELIEDKEGITRGEARLIYNGKNIYDEKTLADYNVKDKTNIFLVIRMTADKGEKV